ncbi:hypothetical protein ABAC460_13230 [Asticcacaulis sp. AC460]|nr:hypothetical protein ABAC460_13230 [Asticcacaulis sp. AC460]
MHTSARDAEFLILPRYTGEVAASDSEQSEGGFGPPVFPRNEHEVYKAWRR